MNIAQGIAQWFTQNKHLTRARELGILVDQQDEWTLSTFAWHVHSRGYVVLQVNRPVYLHHMIMGCLIWEGIVVDHINHNPPDNRRNNLRWVTHAQNLRSNRHPLGQTGERGTTINSNGRYLSRVVWNGVTHHLGTFDTLAEAVAERQQWLVQHGE